MDFEDLEFDADTKVALIFVAFAVAIGSLNGIIGISTLLGAHWGLVFGLAFFYISYRFAPLILDLEETSYEVSAWNLIKSGGLSYWFLFLVSWILFYSLRFFSV